MGWQRHTVRGFMADAMKKGGYTVESFKPENGEQTYRLNAQPGPSCPDIAAGVNVRQAWRNGSQSSAS
jgi:hypothetical protein